MLSSIMEYLHNDGVVKILILVVKVVVGYVFIQLVNYLFKKYLGRQMNRQSSTVISRFIVYGGVILLVMMVLDNFNVKLTTLLGTAGVMGLVLGFASQTSIGNIVSGLFLISEKPFVIGDMIKVGDKSGIVYSIDLLSIKIKTMDNQLIRVPNQTIISTEVTNITRFPIRRMDINIGVSYHDNLDKVEEVLREVARLNILVLDEPEPLVLFTGFGESSVDILFAVWFEKANYVAVKNSVIKSIKAAFDREGIEIPFPYRTLVTGKDGISVAGMANSKNN